MQYAWDPAKAEANLAAHGVSFAEAVTVLEDDFALTREDPESEGEQRFVTLGMSSFGNLLVVVYTDRERTISSASLRRGEPIDGKGYAMKKTAAEPYRDIDFTHAKRGPVVPPEPGKTKISIRLDNRVLEYFRSLVEQAGSGNYQTLINNALLGVHPTTIHAGGSASGGA